MKEKDLIGDKFGKLLPLYPERKNGRIFWVCKCDCGNIINLSGTHLRAGHTLSCGCLKASYGAQQIEKFLIQLKISYEKEKTFPTLKNPKTGKS